MQGRKVLEQPNVFQVFFTRQVLFAVEFTKSLGFSETPQWTF
ncbi:hypothetical protein [Clostridium minihomine]|nr:hypothetical protein [Clostridium minihomine]